MFGKHGQNALWVCWSSVMRSCVAAAEGTAFWLTVVWCWKFHWGEQVLVWPSPSDVEGLDRFIWATLGPFCLTPALPVARQVGCFYVVESQSEFCELVKETEDFRSPHGTGGTWWLRSWVRGDGMTSVNLFINASCSVLWVWLLSLLLNTFFS